MGGLKKGTGSLDFGEEEEPEEEAESTEAEASEERKGEHSEKQTDDQDMDSGSEAETPAETPSSPSTDTTPQGAGFDMDSLPYLVQRQMRGASVNADRTNQLLLEVRPFVKDDEDTFLDDLQGLVDGPVYKGDAREAAMVVAQENPELVAEKLREWGIEYLDK